MEPGLCIAYRDRSGAFRQGVCSGAPADEIAAPEIFASFYRAVFRPGEPVSMPVLVAGSNRGTAVATFDPAMQIGQSWREASRLLSIMAFALAGLCVAVYAALARALRPTRAIGAGLNAARGERSFRAPAPFRSRGIVGDLRRLQHACAAAADHACRTQRVDAKADRSAGRGAASSCPRVARRIRPVAFRHRGAGRRGQPTPRSANARHFMRSAGASRAPRRI